MTPRLWLWLSPWTRYQFFNQELDPSNMGLNLAIHFACGRPTIPSELLLLSSPLCTMTSSNRNIFRVTGPLCGEFTGHRWIPPRRPVTRSFDVFFDLRLNKRLSKQSWGWWFETQSRHYDVTVMGKGDFFQIGGRDLANSNGTSSINRFVHELFWSLQWRQNERDGVSNHWPHHCLLNRLFMRR